MFTKYNFNKALDYIEISLAMDAIPVINVYDTRFLKYYNNKKFDHFMVVNYVDFNAETIMLVDPHYDSAYFGSHLITFDEFNYLAENLAKGTNMNFWMTVYTKG